MNPALGLPIDRFAWCSLGSQSAAGPVRNKFQRNKSPSVQLTCFECVPLEVSVHGEPFGVLI